MGLKPNLKSRLSKLHKKVKQNEQAGVVRKNSFSDIEELEQNQAQADRDIKNTNRPLDPKNSLPVPSTPPPDNLTHRQKLSIAKIGNRNAMKHGIFSMQAPKMTCDNCYLVRSVQDENYQVDPSDIKCPFYKKGHACVYSCVALSNNIRDIDDVKTLMEETIELDMQRLQMARAVEVYDGGGMLDQSLDIGMERMMKNLSLLKELYLELEDMNKVPKEEEGILSKLLNDMSAKAVDAKVEDA